MIMEADGQDVAGSGGNGTLAMVLSRMLKRHMKRNLNLSPNTGKSMLFCGDVDVFFCCTTYSGSWRGDEAMVLVQAMHVHCDWPSADLSISVVVSVCGVLRGNSMLVYVLLL